MAANVPYGRCWRAVNVADISDGRTALMTASQSGHVRIVSLLLAKRSGTTPIMEVCRLGHEAVSADAGAADEYGETSLDLACDRGHEAVVRLLGGPQHIYLPTMTIFDWATARSAPTAQRLAPAVVVRDCCGATGYSSERWSLHSNSSLSLPLPPSARLRRAIAGWKRVPQAEQHRLCELWTDASTTGWGALSRGLFSSWGAWTPLEAKHPIHPAPPPGR
ncbi:hypothetical protein DIPPA_27399 [Diplonema papillatum]|nr:hypothetical protein DIPPA_27399 [Diplonema papillatum]